MTVQELAGEYLKYFEGGNGDSYRCLNDNSPRELKDLAQEAPCEVWGDDYRYRFVEEALWIITDADDVMLDEPEIEPDISNYEIESIGDSEHIMRDVMISQIHEKREVYFSVLESLKNIVEDRICN